MPTAIASVGFVFAVYTATIVLLFASVAYGVPAVSAPFFATIVTIYPSGQKASFEAVSKVRRDYANLHHYHYLELHPDQDSQFESVLKAVVREKPWFDGHFYKPLALLEAMNCTETEWYMFLDSDAWFTQAGMRVPLEAWISSIGSQQHQHYLALEDTQCLNSGAFLVRNSAAGRNLLRLWWTQSLLYDWPAHPHDQAVLRHVVLQLWNSTCISPGPCYHNEAAGCQTIEACMKAWERGVHNLNLRTKPRRRQVLAVQDVLYVLPRTRGLRFQCVCTFTSCRQCMRQIGKFFVFHSGSTNFHGMKHNPPR